MNNIDSVISWINDLLNDLRDRVCVEWINHVGYIIGTEAHYFWEIDQLSPEYVLDAKVAFEKYMGGTAFLDKLNEEQVQYSAIKAGLEAKIAEVRYFHKEDRESRKIIYTSQDCIAFTQYRRSGPEARLFATLRSSDVENLLPVDFYGLLWILYTLDPSYGPAVVSITINNPHIRRTK